MRNLIAFLLLNLNYLQPLGAKPLKPELKLVDGSPWFAEGSEELSGLAIASDGVSLLGVADKDDNTHVLVLRRLGQRFRLESSLALDTLAGYQEYRASLDKVLQLKAEDRRHDFEGIARCGADLYIADERVRKVIKITDGKLIELPLPLTSVKELWTGPANAGFEGIAVDCDAKHLYLAKERDPRILLKFDLETGKLLKQVDELPLSDRDGQFVIDFNRGQGLVQVSRDISDLVFFEGALYLLERYTREIVKLDPISFREQARVSYFFTEFDMYQTPLPYGLAEGLALTKNRIYVAIDHNRDHLTHKAAVKYGISGDHGAVFAFKRPNGF